MASYIESFNGNIKTITSNLVVSEDLTISGDLSVETNAAISGYLVIGGGISTDGNETLKMDVLTGTAAINATSTLTVAHGKSTNIRGVTGFFHTNTTAARGGYAWCDATNVYLYNSSGTNMDSATYYIIVHYV